jgi:hypothetical protein
LYVPEGTLLKMDKTVHDFDASDDELFNLHYSSGNYIYKVGKNQVKCLNCPPEENENDEIDSDSIDSVKTVTINGKEIIRVESSTKTYGNEPKKDVVLIKTK